MHTKKSIGIVFILSLLLLFGCTSQPESRPLQTQQTTDQVITPVDIPQGFATEDSPFVTDKKFVLNPSSEIQTTISVYNAMDVSYSAVQFRISRCVDKSGSKVVAALPELTTQAQDLASHQAKQWTVTIAKAQFVAGRYMCELQAYSGETTLLSKQMIVDVVSP
ncbi:MAG TPA: hypothetical protein VK158_01650 [Acidobacteriota bacterium]|nr:hypothetical protein [Acidobacteriota bacterium]